MRTALFAKYLLAAITLLPLASQAGEIQMLSQDNHVWGCAVGDVGPQCYDLTDSDAVFGTATAYLDVPGYGRVTNGVSSAAGVIDALASVRADDASGWTYTGTYGGAESTYLFTPLISDFTLHFTGEVFMHAGENWVRFELHDLTTNTPVADNYWWTEDWQQIDHTLGTPLIAGHEYSLYMEAQVNVGDSPGATSLLTANIPEPATASLLTLGSLLLLAIRRR